MWNVHEATSKNEERINNVCEGWNNAFASYVSHAHPSLWSLLEALQVDEATASTDIKKIFFSHFFLHFFTYFSLNMFETFRQRHLGASFFIRFLFLIFCL